jgi:hypothetical protein
MTYSRIQLRSFPRSLRRMLTVYLRNSEGGSISKFETTTTKHNVYKWYGCGPTVYDHSHVNIFMYV